MNLYLIPNVGDFTRLAEQTSRAKVPLLTPSSIRELILASAGENTALAAVSPEDLLVLNKYTPTLMDEMPTVVFSIPGLVYSGEWMSLASAFPPVDWTELERKLSKSGHMALTPKDLPGRAVVKADERPRFATGGSDPDQPMSDMDEPVDLEL